MELSRRSFIAGAAPAIVLASSLSRGQGFEHNVKKWEAPRAPEQLIVRFNSRWSREMAYPILRRHGARSIRAFPIEKSFVIMTEVTDAEPLARELSESGLVKYAEPNSIYETCAIPNDPYYTGVSGTQQIMTTMNCPAAWDYQKLQGMSDLIPLVIMSTGCQPDHPDLMANIMTGYNAFDGTSNTSDPTGAGTFVSGPAAGVTDDSIGIASVGWGGGFIPVRACNNSGTIMLSYILAGLTWILGNVAGGCIGTDLPFNMTTALATTKALWNANFLMFGPSGDSGVLGIANGFGDSPYGVVCGAVTNSLGRASYSNYGPSGFGFGGPGCILSAAVGDGGDTPWVTAQPSTYVNNELGTSFSSPMNAAGARFAWQTRKAMKNYNMYDVIFNSANNLATTGFGSFPAPCMDLHAWTVATLTYQPPQHGGASLLGRR